MAIRFFCPFGHRLKVPEERAGKKGRCPVCRQRFIVPEFALPAKKGSKGPWAGSGESSVAITLPSQQSAPLAAPLIVAAEALPMAKPDERLEAIVSPSPTLPAEANPSLPVPSPMVPAVSSPALEPPVADARTVAAVAAKAPVAAVPPPLPPSMAAIASNGALTQTPTSQSSAPRRRIAWAAWAHGAERESFDIVRATPRQLEMVYWLACLLPFAAVFCAAPAVPYIQFAGAPPWAQGLLGIACLELIYAAWLATVPDYSAVRVGMYLLAGITAVELLAALTLPFLPDALLSSAGLAGARATAAAWCGLAVVISGLSSAACRWLQQRWRAGQLKS